MTNDDLEHGLDLNTLVSTFDGVEAEVLRRWLGGDEKGGARIRGGERVLPAPTRTREDDPLAIRSVGVIGGGTAGYLTALALRAKRPGLEVTLLESPTVPIIGVGESTTPMMVSFLHHYLGIDPVELYERVLPTWKLGIKFEWGPDPEGFVAPFDWDVNQIGIRGSLETQGNINAATLQGLMMMADRVPVFDLGGTADRGSTEDGRFVSLMKDLPFSYHLDNGRFVSYLTELAEQRGVHHVDGQIQDVVLDSRGWVDHLRLTDGSVQRFDMYVDCTGFRSVLLGKTLSTPFHSYADSLFTDSAVTGNVDHGGHLKPYTTATTMNAGWRWTIPTLESDHLGYVYASSHLTDDSAAQELAARCPGVTEPRIVRFRVGRHAEAWRANVMGIGNSYAFVEPLESSGLLMITLGILSLVNTLPASWSEPCGRDFVNRALADRWDAIRWFLSIHYRFNTRLDTAFWKDVREHTDVSGLQPLLDVFAAGAPLRGRDRVVKGFANSNAPTFYGLAGVDTILLGQRVTTRLLPLGEPLARWKVRKAGADLLVGRALHQHEALIAYETTPRLHEELLSAPDSWARANNPLSLF